jgi:hypothetical protein
MKKVSNEERGFATRSTAVIDRCYRLVEDRIPGSAAGHRPALLAVLALCCLVLPGCAFTDRRGEIITYTQSMVGISIGQNPATGSPEIKIGYLRANATKVPTGKGTNGIAVPSLQSQIKVGVGTNTHIDETMAMGAATKNLKD